MNHSQNVIPPQPPPPPQELKETPNKIIQKRSVMKIHVGFFLEIFIDYSGYRRIEMKLPQETSAK